MKRADITAKIPNTTKGVNIMTNDSMYEYGPCDDCRAYGDDYYFDKDGECMSRCYDCPFNVYVYDERE